MGKKIEWSTICWAMGKRGAHNGIHAAHLCWPIFQLGGPREFDRKKTGLFRPMGGTRKFADTSGINLIKRTIV